MSHYLEMNEMVPTFRGYFVTGPGPGPAAARRDLSKNRRVGGISCKLPPFIFVSCEQEEASAQLPPVIATNGVMQTLDITTQ